MDRWGLAIPLLALGLVAVVLAAPSGPTDAGSSACGNLTTDAAIQPGGAYDRTTVTLYAAGGTERATVDVRIADTGEKRRVGLSETASLPAGEGMLFVHPSAGRYTYWMRGMDFPLDIVFATANGEITTVHHAPVPERIEGGYGEFTGRGTFVLEVPRGYTNATGVGVGDCIAIPAGVSAAG